MKPVVSSNIVCLGWGSLIWNPDGLPISSAWFEDGPFVPIEFTRQSRGDRITLVIDEHAQPLNVLWARIGVSDLKEAERALCERETGSKVVSSCSGIVAAWTQGQPAPPAIPDLPAWAESHGADSVTWTALRPYFRQEERSPTIAEVIEYLRNLEDPSRAREYVERAPAQIDTPYRRQIERELGWSPRERLDTTRQTFPD